MSLDTITKYFVKTHFIVFYFLCASEQDLIKGRSKYKFVLVLI